MTHRRFRLAVVLVSAAAAIAGSVVLVTRHPGERTTTSGITWTLHVPGHPGSLAAGPDALWLGLADTRSLVRDEPLFRLDLDRVARGGGQPRGAVAGASPHCRSARGSPRRPRQSCVTEQAPHEPRPRSLDADGKPVEAELVRIKRPSAR